MIAAGEESEEPPGFGFVSGLFQKAAAHGDDGVGGEDEGVGLAPGDGFGLGAREALGETGRRLAFQGRFIDVGGDDAVGRDPDLRQQFDAARTGRGQHKRRGGHAAVRLT